jgi:Ca-activated chloride channel homolog
MGPNKYIRSMLVLALCSPVIIPVLALSSDQQADSGEQPVHIRLGVNLVQLPVTVTDDKGHTVPGLKQDAFRVLVDGKSQPISVFHGEDAPVTAGIVVDNSASMSPKRAEVVAAAVAFARGSNPLDQMFVVHFSDHSRLGLPPQTPFTGDASELERAIAGFDLGGTTALYDALMFAQQQFQRALYSRRILLIITDGADNSSTANLGDVVTNAQKAGVVLFAVGMFDESDHDRNKPELTQLGRDTGGEAFFPDTIADIRRICEEIARQIRREYTLGFPGVEDGSYHHIDVTAQDPRYSSLRVHTRPGYFALKP